MDHRKNASPSGKAKYSLIATFWRVPCDRFSPLGVSG